MRSKTQHRATLFSESMHYKCEGSRPNLAAAVVAAVAAASGNYLKQAERWEASTTGTAAIYTSGTAFIRINSSSSSGSSSILAAAATE